MPDGQIQWIDNDQRVVQLARRGREYKAPLSEVDSAARVPGARVHFDITREDGIDGAANVTLRTGSRTNRRHRRFGDLTGARRPGSKAPSIAAERLGVDVATQPLKVVRSWLETISDGDLDAALALYAPDATVHHAGEEVRGRDHIRAFLADEAPRGVDLEATSVAGDDEQVRVDWPSHVQFGTDAPATTELATYFAIDHGHIVEQWDRVEPSDVEPEDGASFVYVVDGPIEEADDRYVRDHFEQLLAGVTGPVLFGRLKLSVFDGGRHRERPVSASATIDQDGHVVRAQVGAATVTEAVDELVARLRRQMKDDADRQHRWPTGQHADATTWQHGKATSVRPSYFDRPIDEREVVRHKSFAPGESTIDEAMWDMAALDFDFFLFTELATGHDCLLVGGGERAELLMLDGDLGDAPQLDLGVANVAVASAGAPTLSLTSAMQRLDAGTESRVFFRNEATERGNVVYRRYDGHYGVITPSG